MGWIKPANITATKLRRIAELSGAEPSMRFLGLMSHVNKETLHQCFNELDGKKAVGIDFRTKEDYRQNLGGNIEDLLKRMKSMSYRPEALREVEIPKVSGKKRTLGISVIEDKIVQMQFSKILMSIYEPIFKDSSYGFRPGRSCHKAIKACMQHLYRNKGSIVIEADIEDFFGSIDQKKLVMFLRKKIKDERFIRYIVRMMKSGVLSKGELRKTDEGLAQGSCCSPILANIYAHYVIDEYLEEEEQERAGLKIRSFRYADDLIICCTGSGYNRYRNSEAERVRELSRKSDELQERISERLSKYGLKLNKEKTRKVEFFRSLAEFKRQGTFDFLGFTIYLGKSRSGNYIPKLKTSSKRRSIKEQVVKAWCRSKRHTGKMSKLWKDFSRKLEGHVRYYGVSFNSEGVESFIYRAIRIFYKWMNRRSQKRSMNWSKFNEFMKFHPPPRVKIYHALF